MKRLAILFVGLLLAARCPADTHYVSLSGTNNSPYTSWPDAATNPIWAVGEAGSGDTVLVSNGVYYMTNQVYKTSAFTFQSFKGRDVTILNGANATTSRCVYFTSASAVFDGFTVTNYHTVGNEGVLSGNNILNCRVENNFNAVDPLSFNTGGRGTLLLSSGAIVTNCIFKNNKNNMIGGAIYANPVTSLRISGCWFEANTSSYGGACGLYGKNMIISNCVIINNNGGYIGGGLWVTAGTNNSVLNCTITGNVANGAAGYGWGGGVGMFGFGVIKDCSIAENVALNKGGGIYVGGDSGTNTMIINCLVARNQSTTNVGGGIWLTNGNVESCTIVSNYAKIAGGGLYLDGSGNGTNDIVYFNTAPNAANFTNTAGNIGLNYCCVIPAVAGTGNITNNPVLKDLAGGDYRLRITSPCVNTGTNQPWMMNAVDLQGNARILKTIVDMGAYETRLWQGTIFSVP